MIKAPQLRLTNAFWACVASLLVFLPTASSAQLPHLVNAFRRADQRAVVLIFDDTVKWDGDVVSLERFALIELPTGRRVALKAQSRPDAPECPRPRSSALSSTDARWFERNRLCVELRADEQPLPDNVAFALITDTLVIAGEKVAPAIVTLPIATAKAESPRSGAARISATISRELYRSDVRPIVVVNRIVASLGPHPGTPHCFQPATLTFVCPLERKLDAGDSVWFRIVAGSDTLFKADPVVVPGEVPTKADDAEWFTGSIAYARADAEDKGTFTFKTIAQPLRSADARPGFSSTVHLYSDVTLSTQRDGKHRIAFGPRIAFRKVVGRPPVGGKASLVRAFTLDFSPLWEMDDDAVVRNLLAGLEPSVYIPRLGVGLPAYGMARINPRVRLEAGRTIVGDDSLRIEDESPLRLTYGTDFTLSWPAKALPVLVHGASFKVEYRRYALQHNPSASRTVPNVPQHFAFTGTLNFAPNLGLAITRRSGRVAPLFIHQNTFDIGATMFR